MGELVVMPKRPSAHFDEKECSVKIYCTPELYKVFTSMTSKDKQGANEMMVLLKAMKQIKELLLDKSEEENGESNNG